jgi:Na+-driven multidrug efflux pump
LGDWQTGVVGPLGALVVFALAALWFVPRLGVDGVAMAVVLAWAAAFLYVVYQVSRRLQLSIRDCLIPPMDKPALAYRAMVSSAIFRDATFFSIFRKSL